MHVCHLVRTPLKSLLCLGWEYSGSRNINELQSDNGKQQDMCLLLYLPIQLPSLQRFYRYRRRWVPFRRVATSQQWLHWGIRISLGGCGAVPLNIQSSVFPSSPREISSFKFAYFLPHDFNQFYVPNRSYWDPRKEKERRNCIFCGSNEFGLVIIMLRIIPSVATMEFVNDGVNPLVGE